MNLIEITSVPISIELKIKNASLVREHDNTPKINVTRDKDELIIQQESIKVNSCYDASSLTSDGNSYLSGNLKDFISFSYNATASLEADDSLTENAVGENPITEITLKRFQKSLEKMLSILPNIASNVSWDGKTLNMQYQLDEQSFDWEALQPPAFEFIPGSIEFNVKELPKVKIEYLGGPIYFPKSANPNYTDLDIKA
ncbi:MAG TPA: hypothetical protein DCP97_00895 [Ruminococcaceae bacterium]|nr:hypothetical protein [Oscillospiraceae bacterium]